MRLHDALENASGLVSLGYKKQGIRGRSREGGGQHGATKFAFIRYHEEKRKIRELFK